MFQRFLKPQCIGGQYYPDSPFKCILNWELPSSLSPHFSLRALRGHTPSHSFLCRGKVSLQAAKQQSTFLFWFQVMQLKRIEAEDRLHRNIPRRYLPSQSRHYVCLFFHLTLHCKLLCYKYVDLEMFDFPLIAYNCLTVKKFLIAVKEQPHESA